MLEDFTRDNENMHKAISNLHIVDVDPNVLSDATSDEPTPKTPRRSERNEV